MEQLLSSLLLPNLPESRVTPRCRGELICFTMEPPGVGPAAPPGASSEGTQGGCRWAQSKTPWVQVPAASCSRCSAKTHQFPAQTQCELPSRAGSALHHGACGFPRTSHANSSSPVCLAQSTSSEARAAYTFISASLQANGRLWPSCTLLEKSHHAWHHCTP